MLGGISGSHRAVREDDDFERDLRDEFGEEMKVDEDLCREWWAALSNIVWKRGDDEVSYSFRAAGDLIDAVIEAGDYMDWYCCSRWGLVSERIAARMAARSWTWSPRPLTSAP